MTASENPLLQPSTLDYQLPDFKAIRNEHFLPALKIGMGRHYEEIQAIVDNPDEPTWENTVEALEKAGSDLERVSSVFFNLYGTDSSDELEEIAAEIIPDLAAHSDGIWLRNDLFERIQAVDVPEDEESQRLYDYLLRTFRRHGVNLGPEEREELITISERLSTLSESFGRNLLADTKSLAPTFSAEELAGLSEGEIATAAKDAEALGKEGYVLPLGLPSVQPAQADLLEPASRAKLYNASQQRGAERNGDVLVEMVQLRARRAEILGYRTHADYILEEETAGSADAVRDLIRGLAPAANTNAINEHKLLEEAARTAEGEDATVTGADWPYWENKVRERDFHVDSGELAKYFPLQQVLRDGVFYAANLLYGISVTERTDLVGYAEGVQVWEVFDQHQPHTPGQGIGLLLTDYFGRPSKRGGAWMSSFVNQSRLLGTKPVIVNVMGITKPADGSEPLLSIDQVTTVFHEFGHALHGLLSDVRYPSFSGTSVPRDYVEFPSQINENWAFEPRVISNYARHIETGEPLPAELIETVRELRQFGQGFATTEYLGAAALDFAWHNLTAEQAQQLSAVDIEDFEQRALADVGITIPEVAPRYRSTYFNHIFAGGYSAGYYSYLWAEVLDADGFDWFSQHTGSTEELRSAGQTFRDLVLSRGASKDYTEAFRELRGRDKELKPLLERRGLAGAIEE